jgi:SH3 domain-containing YSC84-like protein 1
MKSLFVVAAAICFSSVALAKDVDERLSSAAMVLRDVMAAPDKGIPHDLLNKAYCVVVVPSLKKGAFVVGGEYGKGFVDCRSGPGQQWGAPAAIRVEGGSFGFQIGGESTEVIMLIMNEHGMKQLEKDKFTLGGDASIAAGPVGRTATADTDVALTAEILSWSRTKGLFAGVSLKGATLRPDKDDNKELYGTSMGTREVFAAHLPPPPAAHALIAELDRYSPASEADRSK